MRAHREQAGSISAYRLDAFGPAKDLDQSIAARHLYDRRDLPGEQCLERIPQFQPQTFGIDNPHITAVVRGRVNGVFMRQDREVFAFLQSMQKIRRLRERIDQDELHWPRVRRVA